MSVCTLRAVITTSTASLCLLLSAVVGAAAQGSPGAKPKVLGVSAIPVGTPSLAIYWIGQALGYYDQEGIDATMEAIPGGNVAQGAQMVINGRADFVVQLFEGVIAPVAQGKDPGLTFVYSVYQRPTFRMLVPGGAQYTSVAQLKGKRIGIPAPGLPVEPLFKAFVAPSGLSPDDFPVDIVGVGIPAAEALKNGRIDALFTATVTLGQYRGAGYDFRELPTPPEFGKLVGPSAAVRRDTLKDPARRNAVIRMLRAWAKSTAFAVANPEAAIKLDYQLFPEMKPKNVSEAAAIEQGLIAIKIGMQDWGVKYDGKWGKQRDDSVVTIANNLGVKVPDPNALFTNELIDDINNFDEAAVIKQAKEFR